MAVVVIRMSRMFFMMPFEGEKKKERRMNADIIRRCRRVYVISR